MVISILVLATGIARADETLARYFEQLRQRGLFSLAESDAISRLAVDNLSLAVRTDLSIELSRSLTQHAGFVSDEQRNELWQRAQTTVQDLLSREPTNPRSILLRGQLASVFVIEGDWLRAERELRPFDEPLLNQARAACSKAIEQLKSVEAILVEPSRDPNMKKSLPGTPHGYEIRVLLHQVRLQLGLSYRNRAELSPPNSAERAKDIADAEQSLRRLIGVADEPVQSRAKLLLVVCIRLKNEAERASENLAALEKAEPKPIDAVQDEIAGEKVRLLMELQKPTEAAEFLLKTRGKRQRLTGELWLLQARALIALRQITLEKHQETLAERLSEQIVTTIQRCDEQVGGYWSRRCRQLWENTQTSQKYGAELDSLMQQARTEFSAGRIDSALAQYATAEKKAVQQNQRELAMDLGFTRASILLDGMQFETAAAEFFRLSSEYASHARAAKSHLLGTYCLGRLYDEKKSQSRREAYTEALDRHLQNYAADPTVNDARFLKAQLEEQRLQATLALPLYLQVDSGHPRRLDAMAGAARCYETILRRMIERHLASDELEREAITKLSAVLSQVGDSSDQWTAAHAEISLRLAAILLMGSGDGAASRCHQAERWLLRAISFAERKDSDAALAENNAQVRRRAAPLLIVAQAGSGKTAEAEQALNSISVSPPELLAVLDRLTRFVAATHGEQRLQIASLQLRAAERLSEHKDQLSPTDREIFERCLMNAYVRAGQYNKAVDLGQKTAERTIKDFDKQRELAMLFGDIANSEAQSLSKQCWRRVESLSKAGSPEWMAARMAVLKACTQLGQFDEGRKLLQVTKVLYPNLGGELMKSQFETIEKELQSGKILKK